MRRGCVRRRSLSRSTRTSCPVNAARWLGHPWRWRPPLSWPLGRSGLCPSYGTDLGCLRALLSGFDDELDLLAFSQFAVALHVDVGLVDEEVARPVFRRDEAETLGRVEPLDRTYCHDWNLLLQNQKHAIGDFANRSQCYGHSAAT